jgi:xanthine dehydrogenase accessory factor
MKKLIEQLCTTLDNGEDLVLATVCSQSGSTPRVAGARMVVHSDGRIHGTIGGGLVEATAIRDAADCFQNGRSRCHSFDLSNDDAAVTDMICGGRMECCLEFVPADSHNRAVFGELLGALRSGRRAILVSPLSGDTGEGRFVLDHKGRTDSTVVPEPLLSAVRQLRPSTSAATILASGGQDYLASSFAVGGTLYLIGAGHVAGCTAEAAARVGFRVVVMDDRAEFANRQRFPLADEVRVLPSFADCLPAAEIDSDSYLVIVTPAGYIGMIGSRKKRNAIYTRLLDRGVTEAQLEQVRCPIGMAIEADTPEEIAVSIVGELIYQRATGRKAWHLA